MWTLSEACAAVGGNLLGADASFASVGTDSRVGCEGQLFVALRGARFDGHDHCTAAIARGAVAVMVDHPLGLDIPQWVVDDTRLGLGRLAAAWRDRLHGQVVAVTGSNGKTTVKEMLAAIFSRAGTTLATRGNLNNDIGMPLTLLGARDESYLVLEMGANHPGEIGYMSAIARPCLALITNAGRAHLEGFGSVEGVARAKGEIVRGVAVGGVFVVPGDSPYLGLWRELAGDRDVRTFALDRAADLSADSESISVLWGEDGFRTAFDARIGDGLLPLELRLAGAHNVRNALAACAAALALGIDAEVIRSGLLDLRPVTGRLCPSECGGIHTIDDTYNANPDSIAAAVSVLTALPGRHWMVLGDLGELGADAVTLHGEVGAVARAAGVERLATVGSLSAEATNAFGDGARHFPDQSALVAYLHDALVPGDCVLVKGSRTSHMESVVSALCGERGV